MQYFSDRLQDVWTFDWGSTKQTKLMFSKICLHGYHGYPYKLTMQRSNGVLRSEIHAANVFLEIN